MPIDEEAYGRALKACHLAGLEMVSCSAELRVPESDLDYRFQTHVEPLSVSDEDPHVAVMQVKMSLTAGTLSSRRVGLKLSSVWRLVITSDHPLSSEFRQAYLEHNAAFNLWPHFRAWICDITARLGLMPLVLPFRFG